MCSTTGCAPTPGLGNRVPSHQPLLLTHTGCELATRDQNIRSAAPSPLKSALTTLSYTPLIVTGAERGPVVLPNHTTSGSVPGPYQSTSSTWPSASKSPTTGW